MGIELLLLALTAYCGSVSLASYRCLAFSGQKFCLTLLAGIGLTIIMGLFTCHLERMLYGTELVCSLVLAGSVVWRLIDPQKYSYLLVSLVCCVFSIRHLLPLYHKFEPYQLAIVLAGMLLLYWLAQYAVKCEYRRFNRSVLIILLVLAVYRSIGTTQLAHHHLGLNKQDPGIELGSSN